MAGGGGGVNPFLSDTDEDDDEVAARRPGLRLGPDPGSADSLSPQDPAAAAGAAGSAARPGPPGEAAAAAMTAAPAPGSGAETPARLSVDAIAAQLLRDQYLLTALELHTELLESGRELPRLRDYFSNPGNFERQSGTPPGFGAPGFPGAAGLGAAGGGREPSTASGGGQLSKWLPPGSLLNIWVRGRTRRAHLQEGLAGPGPLGIYAAGVGASGVRERTPPNPKSASQHAPVSPLELPCWMH